jgi:peroxiredoxin
MVQQSAGVTSAAKKSVLLLFILIAVTALFLFVFVPKQRSGPRIIGQGDRAPEFRLPKLNGGEVSLSEFKGKVVMVHFWATWCPPCVEEIPAIGKLYRDLSGKDFEILAVSVDEGGAGTISAFVQQNKLELPVLLDPARSVSGLYGTFKFPETYILDRNGIVKFKAIGPREWNDPSVVKALQDLIAAQ